MLGIGRKRDDDAWELPRPACAFLVESASPALPAVSAVANPGGAGGALDGWAARAEGGRPVDDPLSLDAPMRDGLAFWVMGPSRAAVELETRAAGGERTTVRVTQRLPGDSPVAGALFTSRLARRLASLVDGIVTDVVARRTFRPADVAESEGVDVLEHVSIEHVPAHGPDGDWIHTHGLRKFGQPELEVYGVPGELAEAATAALGRLAQGLLDGETLGPGETVGSAPVALRAQAGGHDREHWGDDAVLELVCTRGVRAWLAAA